jgi:cytoskeletal protein CcmA (bactofilin family)
MNTSKTTDASSSGTSSTSQAAEPAKKGGPSGVPSIISADLKIVGDLKCSGDVQVDGTVEGDINSRLLIVGSNARIEGSISAETVRISGTVQGEVKAKSVTLDKTAKVTGDVVHENLTMEAGAFLEGGVRRLQAGTANVAPLRPAGAPSTGGSESQPRYGDSQRSSVL